uniref:Conotoxin n=1 Tax=Conus imperialis TaxID=35631 RepID=H8Y818_CONIM|nr:conotoxin Im5.5 [Conus imperialis]
MYCLPVFIILLLLIPSAPSVDVQPITKNDVILDSLRNVATKPLQRLLNTRCCIKFHPCCHNG